MRKTQNEIYGYNVIRT